MAGTLPQRVSSLHRRHLSLGAHMTDEGGWQRAARYSSPEEEAAAVRTGVGLCDTSPMGKLLVQGDDVAGFLGASLSATDVPLPGSVSWHSESTLLCRLASDQILVLTTPETAGRTRTVLDAQHDENVHLVDMTSALTGLCVAGPRSADVLVKVTNLDLAGPTASNMTCAQTSLSGVQGILVRADFRDVPCYRIFVSRDLGEFAWDVLMEAGSREGLKPFGVEALRLLRGEG